jgi:replication factor A1
MNTDLEARVKSLEDTLQRITQALIAAPQKTTTNPATTTQPTKPTSTPTKRHLIVELQDGMKRVNVTAQVMEKDEAHTVTTGTGPTETCYVMIADESGRIKLSLWGEQVKQVNVTDNVTVENGYVSSYKGEIQLNVGKWGKLTVGANP